MKKKLTVIILALVCSISVTGCGNVVRHFLSQREAQEREERREDKEEHEDDEDKEKESEHDTGNKKKDGVEERNFGSYQIPEGWQKSETHSTKSKYFYVEEGHDKDKTPNNISVEADSNRYSEDQVMEFKDAILSQLMMQMKDKDVSMQGDGTYTEQGYPLLVFDMLDNESGIRTIQYYIVGDHEFCLVHLTVFDGDEDAKDAAEEIVDSFVWEEKD